MRSTDPYIANVEAFLDGVDPHADTLAHFLARGRKARDMTQVALGAEVGLAQDHISGFECGRRKPTRTQLDRICKALDLDRDEAHALLGQLPLDVEAAWLSNINLRYEVRDFINGYPGLVEGDE